MAKNVKVTHNEFGGPARPIISIGADNPAFESPAGLVGANPIDVTLDRNQYPSI